MYSAPVAKAGLSAPVFEIFFKIRRIVNFFKEGYVPLDSILGHIGRAENAAQHQIMDVNAETLLDGGDSFQSATGMRAVSKTASGRTLPFFQ